jgi:hypothetical protein
VSIDRFCICLVVNGCIYCTNELVYVLLPCGVSKVGNGFAIKPGNGQPHWRFPSPGDILEVARMTPLHFECFLTTKEKHMIVWKPEVLAILYGTFANINTCSIVINLTSKQHDVEKEQRNLPTCHILTCDMLPHLTSCFRLETHFKLRIIIYLFVGTV